MSEENQTGSGKGSFTGKYGLVSNENFDAFLQANGANWMIRQMAKLTSPDLVIQQDGDKFDFKLISALKTRQLIFTVGQDFEDTQHDGTVMVITPSWDEGKLVLNYKPKTDGVGKPQKHVRELTDDGLILTLEVENIKAKRIFKRKE